MNIKNKTHPHRSKFIISLALGAILTIVSPFLVLYFDFLQYNKTLSFTKLFDIVYCSIF